MKKIIYIANARIPTEKAHGVQIMKMCEAFSNLNYNVEFFVPFRFNTIKKDPFKFYGLKKKFKIKKVFSLDFMPMERIFGKISFLIQLYSFAVTIFLSKYKLTADYIYCRDNLLLPFLFKLGIPVIYEAHVFPSNIRSGKIDNWRKCHKIITITHHLKKMFVEKGIEESKILVAPDGVDFKNFSINEKKEECRQRLDLINNKKIILYTGHLYGWKGAHTLMEAAKKMKDDKSVIFVFVGGTEKDINIFRESATGFDTIKILGHRPHSQMPLYLRAADILILPNSGHEKISRYYTSPMKLFEYMASGTPIIASKLPSIEEILNEENSIFFIPDNADSLVEKIKMVLHLPQGIIRCAQKAEQDVLRYTWNKRANNILTFINNGNR